MPDKKKSTFEEIVDRVNKAVGWNQKTPTPMPGNPQGQKGSDVQKIQDRADSMVNDNVDPTPTPTPKPTKKKKY